MQGLKQVLIRHRLLLHQFASVSEVDSRVLLRVCFQEIDTISSLFSGVLFFFRRTCGFTNFCSLVNDTNNHYEVCPEQVCMVCGDGCAELMRNTTCPQRTKVPAPVQRLGCPCLRLITTSAKTCFSLKSQKGFIFLCFLSLAAEPVLSHYKQLLFLIYTSGVGSWTNFIRAHDHHSLQD